MPHRRSFLTLIIIALAAGCSAAGARPMAQPTAPTIIALPLITTAAAADSGVVTIGSASVGTPASPTTRCNDPRTQFTAANTGVVTATDGSQWVVPAPVTVGAVALDIYNDCTGAGDIADVAAQLQTVVIDPDGVEITGYIFGDNYFELFVNGQFVARDAIAFTPFNASVVRFKAKYPITYAIKLVDWESHLGVGMEYDTYNVGDGGFIAAFSDGTITGKDWQAQSFYIAPLDSPSCVNGHDAASCPVRPSCADRNPGLCQALHFAVPADWAAPAFDDTRWPSATLWTADEVTNAPAYRNYTQRFGAARFMWTSSLKLDNLVLVRKTVSAPTTGQ